MILSRYVGRSIVLHTLAVTLVLLSITLLSQLIRFLKLIIRGELPADYLILMILFRLPQFLELILPFGLFIGSLIALRKMSYDREMVVMMVGGISSYRLYWFSLKPVLLFSVIVAMLTLFVSPYMMQRAHNLITNPDSYQDLSLQSVGQFKESNNSLQAIYISSAIPESDQFERVFVGELFLEDNSINFSVLFSDKGAIQVSKDTGKRYLFFFDGVQYSGSMSDIELERVDFESYAKIINRGDQNLPKIKSDARSSLDLLKSNIIKDQASLQWRVNIPILMMVASLIVFSMSRVDTRRKGSISLIITLALFLSYFVCLSLTRSLVGKGEIVVELGYGAFSWLISEYKHYHHD